MTNIYHGSFLTKGHEVHDPESQVSSASNELEDYQEVSDELSGSA